MGTPTPEHPRTETLALINSEITASLERQADAGSRIDTKAVALVAYAGVAASFLATRHAELVLAAIAYAAFGASAGIGIWSYGIRSYEEVPAPRSLFNAYLTRDPADALAALAASRIPAFERNAAKNQRKARLWLISLASLMTGIVLMLLAVTLAAHTGSHGNRGGSGQSHATIWPRPRA